MNIVENNLSVSIDEFMQAPLFAHLATLGSTSPCDSPVWVLWKDNKIYICTNIQNDSFAKRIKEEEKCAIGLVDYEAKSGKLWHVGFRGVATIIDFNYDIAEQIFTKYLGHEKQLWPTGFAEFLLDKNARLIEFKPKTAIFRDRSFTFKET